MFIILRGLLKSRRGEFAQNLSLVAMLVVLLFVAYFYIIKEDNNGGYEAENTSSTVSTSETTNQFSDTPSGNTLVVSGSVFDSINIERDILTLNVVLRANSVTNLDAENTNIITHANSSAIGTVLTSILPSTLNPGNNGVSIRFTSTANGDFDDGPYIISLSWTGDGDNHKILEISVTASR